MRKWFCSILLALVVLGFAANSHVVDFARADDPAPAVKPAIDPAIAPYVGPATIALFRVDSSRMNLDAMQASFTACLLNGMKANDPTGPNLTELPADKAADIANARRVADEFKATGATKIYGVMTFNPGSPKGLAIMLLVPTGPNVDAASLGNLLLSGHSKGPLPNIAAGDPNVRIVKDALLFGPDEDLDFLVKTDPDPRPDIASAMAAGGDADSCMAFSPSSALRVAMALMIGPTLPPEFGSAPTMSVTQGCSWSSISMNTSDPSARLIIQCISPDAADTIQKTVVAGINTLKTKTFPAQVPKSAPDLSQLMDQLSPKLDGTQLKTEVKGDAFFGALTTFFRAAAETGGK